MPSRNSSSSSWTSSRVPRTDTDRALRGFTRSNLFRMRQFYETYRGQPKVAPLARQLSWSHNLTIMGQSKRAEERGFYLRLAVQEKWSKRELERQFKAALFERAIVEPAKVSKALRQSHPDGLGVFKDSYLVEFLDLARTHDETDLHNGLFSHLKDFLLELGRDFCFVGTKYPVQVGDRALSRTLSPAVIADYQTQLPDKKLLQAKLREFSVIDGELTNP